MTRFEYTQYGGRANAVTTKPAPKCMLKTQWRACCCNCQHHLKDKGLKGRYICIGFAHEGVGISDFNKHGLCEMHRERGVHA